MRTKLFSLVLIFAFILSACAESVVTLPEQIGSPDASSGIDGVLVYPAYTGNQEHVDVDVVAIGNLPPTMGKHNAQWQNCGIYEQPVELKYANHSLEHGAVWITYRPDLAADKVSVLQKLTRGHTHVLLSPYETQTADVVLTAWGVQLVLENFPDDRAAAFIAYYENGPQNPEPGAPCSGKVGNPLP